MGNLKELFEKENHLLNHLSDRKELLRNDKYKLFPWIFPCRVKVLLVTDGSLNFGMGDFGLSAFINCMLNDGRSYLKFDITLAHLRTDVIDSDMGSTESGIKKRIKDFRFDNRDHFNETMYDQIWLFGIETNYYSVNSVTGEFYYKARYSNQAIYPADRLSNKELEVIESFMDSGRGIFATGDHGALGKGLCGSIKRVKSMRLWDSTSTSEDIDSVSMAGQNRNDTSQIGDAGTQFSDQSDDIPQPIEPKLYYHRVGYSINELYPHPLLCSNLGIINVLPDHAHEGECRVPSSREEREEFPMIGTLQVLPEVIATSNVIAGNTATLGTSFSKHATIAQTFGAISAYDGHRVNVGRIVTDATWHHFINVNLIGLVEGGGFDDLTPANSTTKHDGFLSTPTGQAHMAKIKEYYINIGTWISPPNFISCFQDKLLYKLLYSDRVMEAALVDPNVNIEKISLSLFYGIGTHARDVLNRSASPCSALQFILTQANNLLPELTSYIDPWFPRPIQKPEPEPPLPWFDPMPVLNIMLGTILVMVRQAVPYPPEKIDSNFAKKVNEIVRNAAMQGLEIGLRHYASEAKKYDALLNTSLRSLTVKDKEKR
jgi:hypothetical protein